MIDYYAGMTDCKAGSQSLIGIIFGIILCIMNSDSFSLNQRNISLIYTVNEKISLN